MLRCCLVLAAALPVLFAQDAGLRPPPYRGVNMVMDGVFVTPVPGLPFSAVVQLESTQFLADGTSATRRSIATIDRDSQGRIYNERRQLMPASFGGTPRVLGGHIFDPQTRLSTFLDPYRRLARQTTVAERSVGATPPAALLNTPNFKQEISVRKRSRTLRCAACAKPEPFPQPPLAPRKTSSSPTNIGTPTSCT